MRKTILIVCEGDSTEPDYFRSIRDILIDKKIDVSLRISPMPKNEEKQEEHTRTGGAKRPLKMLEPGKEQKLREYTIEEEYRPQPIRYVREAQMGLEDGTYDEVWAVFDKDGHPKQKEAFDLANTVISGQRVNIAFSSVAFEQWILLHFEYNQVAFVKSQCRDGDTILHCGSQTHADDCAGSKCICGRMSTQKYHTVGAAKKFLFHELPDCTVAINNAHGLRNFTIQNSAHLPIYEYNPYTDVDKLVFKLFQLPKNFEWTNNPIQYKPISFTISHDNNLIRVVVANQNPQTRFILNDGYLCLVNALGESRPFCGRTMIEESSIIDFDLTSIPGFNPKYISYQVGEDKYLITDIP